jgi:hypothetical protein
MLEESFIKNVNILANFFNDEKFVEGIKNLDDTTDEKINLISSMNIAEIVEDLKKGNYLGNRKIDIDLRLNNQSNESECTYKSITLTLNNGITHTIEFTRVDESGNSVIEELSSYTAIYTKLIDGIESYNTAEPDTQKHIVNYEIDVINETIDDLPTLLRIRDTDGSACNIDRITLEYYNGGTPIENNPSYFWAKTTSSLEVLANRVGDIIALGEDIDKIIALSDKEDEIQALYDMRVVLAELHTDLSKIVRVYASIDNVDYIVDTLETKMDYTKDTLETKMDYTKDTLESKMDYTKDTLETKMDSVLDIKDDILLVPTKVSEVKEIRDELTGITPEITQLSFGQPIHVTYSKDTGKLSFYIPQGAKGEKGDPFNVDAIGLAADRSDYNNQPKGYAYLATDESKLYFKMSDLDEDNWSIGSPFGKGDTGNGIIDIQRTAGDGSAGTVDTYTITLDDGSVRTFSVTNGVDTYTKAEIDNKINSLDTEKYLNTASFNNETNTLTLRLNDGTTQNIIIPDDKILLVNDLATGGTNKALSAQQGVEILTLINNIKSFDYSSDTNPTVKTNPNETGATWINKTSGEIFVCIDNYTNDNIWKGTSGTSILNTINVVDFFGDGSGKSLYEFNDNFLDTGGITTAGNNGSGSVVFENNISPKIKNIVGNEYYNGFQFNFNLSDGSIDTSDKSISFWFKREYARYKSFEFEGVALGQLNHEQVYFITIVAQDSEATIYLDGSLYTTLSLSSIRKQYLSFGQAISEQFVPHIAWVRMFDRVLTAEEIIELYNEKDYLRI